MAVLSTGSPDPDDPKPTREEPARPSGLHGDSSTTGRPPPEVAPHEGVVGNLADPLRSDPRPGNVGHAAEAPVEEKDNLLDEAADESFPASDPPSWSASPTTGEERPDPPGTPGRSKRVGLGRIVSESDRTR
jgi:hypothetical protein